MRDWRPDFIRWVRSGKSTQEAAELVGVHRDTPCARRRRGDGGFAHDWLEALVLHRDPVCRVCGTAPSIKAVPGAGDPGQASDLHGVCGRCGDTSAPSVAA